MIAFYYGTFDVELKSMKERTVIDFLCTCMTRLDLFLCKYSIFLYCSGHRRPVRPHDGRLRHLLRGARLLRLQGGHGRGQDGLLILNAY